MGVPGPLIEFFLQEHRYRPWSGRLLSLGRQTILVEPPRLQQLFGRYGIGWDPQCAEVDRATVAAKAAPRRKYVTDETLFKALNPGLRLDVMDVTDYEGANLIWNICKPVPEHLHGTYDVIFNGSVLDNIFDPAQAIRNMTRLLAPHGRVIHIEMASNLAFEYLIYSTDWFFDYYIENGFVDSRIYVCTFNNLDELLNGPWQVYAYMPRPDGDASSLRALGLQHGVVVAIAEKGEASSVDAIPVQWCYRDEAMKRRFNERMAKLDERRPVFGFGGQQPPDFSTIKRSGGFHSCGPAFG